jgi:hypothetical protein
MLFLVNLMTYDRFDHNDDEQINGYAAECLFANAVQKSKKIHTYDFNSQVLASAIESDSAGRKHLRIAEPFLVKEFAEISVDEIGRKSFALPLLKDLPAVTILDRILGLDFCIEFFGYRIGVDVTVNADAEGNKFRKKRELANVYTKLGFDRIVILIIDKTFNSQELESKLKIIKNSDVFSINHTVTI